MAGRNGFVDTRVSIPTELHWLVLQYGSCRRIAGFSGMIKELLETHPALAQLAMEAYTGNVQQPSEGNAHS